MYRAITLYLMRHGLLDASDAEKVAIIDKISLGYVYNKKTDNFDMYLDGENVEQEIRKTDLSLYLHKIVSIPGVRSKLVALQQKYGEQ